MRTAKFKLTAFKNRNGSKSWRVEGCLHGQRIRRNFKCRDNAAAEVAALEVRALQSESWLRPVVTALSESQVREAESLFTRVKDKAHPLSFYVDYGLRHHADREVEMSLDEGISNYIKCKV